MTLTPGNPLAVLLLREGSPKKPGKQDLVGKIGHWTVYEVKKGGMGDVLICGSGDSPPQFALKSFQPRLFFDPESRRAFLREITIWLRLAGTPFVMPALNLEEHSGRFFVLMPAVFEDQRHVVTVHDLIERKVATTVEAFTIAWQFALGMKFAGDAIPGMSHGDLKPANLLYNGGPLMISDFGLAVIDRSERPALRATPGYEAPEYSVTGPTPASDVYSFGVIVSELAESCAKEKRSFFSRNTASALVSPVKELHEIAETCRHRDPQRRPDFQDIVKKLGDVVLAHPAKLRDMFIWTGELHGGFRKMQGSMLPDIAESLLKIDEPAHAMEVLDSIDEAKRVTRVFVLKGTCLSLMNRDDEAIHLFEKALAEQLSEKERLNCLSEYALSLKRLRRFTEAEDIYSDLLGRAPDTQLAQIVINLASVYVEEKKHQKVVDLVTRFLRSHQDEPLAFAVLGNAYASLGRYEEATSQYQRALALAPHLANIQVAFARICLHKLGRWEDADAALFAAHQQGFFSMEWLVLAVAASTVLGHKGDVDELMRAARRDLSAAQVERLEKEAMDLTLDALRKAVGSESPVKETSGPEVGEISETPFSETPVASEVPKEQVPTGDPPVSSSFQPAGLPFFNIRFYLPENRFSFDFYDQLDRTDYVTRFVESWNRFQRDPELNHGADLRATPLYFHECPQCRVYVLTNRDEGQNLNCRQCDQRNPTRRVVTERTKELLGLVHQALGKKLKSHRGLTLFLMFQPVADNPDHLVQMKTLCEEAGFEPFTAIDSPLRYFMRMFAKNAGLSFDERREIVVVFIQSIADGPSYEGDTPPETDRLLRKLRQVAPIVSTSVDLDPEAGDPFSLFLAGNRQALEQQVRREVAESPDDTANVRLLIEILREDKKYVEAKTLALRSTISAPGDPNSWTALGRVEMDLGEYPSAILHLNNALAIDPLQRDALISLFLCYQKSNQSEKAREVCSRIEALGGPTLFG